MLTLRGPQYLMKTELEEMKSIIASQSDEDGEISSLDKIKHKIKEMSSRTVLLPILMMTLMCSLQPLSGSDTVSFYSLDIFRRANVKMNNYVLSILVNSGFTIGYMVSAMLMTRVGRKMQFICSGLFMAVSLATLGFTLDAEVCLELIVYDRFYVSVLHLFSFRVLRMKIGKIWPMHCYPYVSFLLD